MRERTRLAARVGKSKRLSETRRRRNRAFSRTRETAQEALDQRRYTPCKLNPARKRAGREDRRLDSMNFIPASLMLERDRCPRAEVIRERWVDRLFQSWNQPLSAFAMHFRRPVLQRGDSRVIAGRGSLSRAGGRKPRACHADRDARFDQSSPCSSRSLPQKTSPSRVARQGAPGSPKALATAHSISSRSLTVP